MTTETGRFDLAVPRDRAGTFEPVTVPKHRRRLEGLSANVISLYAKVLTTGEIQAHLAEIYAAEVDTSNTAPAATARGVHRRGLLGCPGIRGSKGALRRGSYRHHGGLRQWRGSCCSVLTRQWWRRRW